MRNGEAFLLLPHVHAHEDQIADPEYAWVSRHTWQSWRERYKKNAVRLDTMIAQIVDQKKPIPGEQGQYGYVRLDEEKYYKRPRKKRAKPAEQNLHKQEMIIGGINANSAEVPVIVFDASPVDSGPSTSRAFVRRSPAEEELEDGEDSEEWAVRIGNEPPPKWGKRHASEESEAQKPRKRMKSKCVVMVVTESHGLMDFFSDTDSIQGNSLDPGVHLIDRTLQEIATEHRFTLEEVKEFYDQCGEMERTKIRFHKMRQILSSIGES